MTDRSFYPGDDLTGSYESRAVLLGPGHRVVDVARESALSVLFEHTTTDFGVDLTAALKSGFSPRVMAPSSPGLSAIILVGGVGSRMRPLTFERPKQMLPLVGQPMIEHVVGWLAQHGVTKAVLSLGYLPDHFVEAYPSGVIAGVTVTYAVEPEPLDTAGAIRFAATFAGIDDTFLVVNGDVITDLNISRLLAFHRERRAEVTIALHAVDDPSRFGVVPITPDGRVISFIEKPDRLTAPSNFVNAGTYVMEPRALRRIPPTGPASVERDTFVRLAGAGTLYAMTDDAYWFDAGTPESFLSANSFLLQRQSVEGRVGSHDSWVHPHARVSSSSSISSSVIDESCSVDADAVIDNAVLLPGAEVEAGAQVRSSIIGPRAVVGRLSNLGATCVVGASFQVANESELSGRVRLGARP
ncbi:MAG TPA: NDP-sugar synthase [Acidimicrobiales bacterium]|nr:NDP-sugar synthase [Acidimicrobiales bacterium]